MRGEKLAGLAVLKRGVLLSASSGVALLMASSGAVATTFISPDSLLVSTTTYEDAGPVSNLVAGTSKLPGGTATTTSTAVSNGAYKTVFNNASVDSSFGVTSPITLQDLNPTTAAVNASLAIDPSLVSTSFSSKSELGLSVANTSAGPVLTFMGYAGGGVGNLDVSNSDTTAYKDTTNPVTGFFAPGANQTYAFNRAVVAVSGNGGVSTTQTLAYGGNNGRAAVLGPNGQYYTVGNSNNGTGTPIQLAQTTGLNVVTPGSTPNSTMVDPTFKPIAGDKNGKSSNFRGLTYYDGSLYFSKGSGGNGVNTVYTVSNPALPTPANAATATVSILPGFPTTSAKLPGGEDYTPFGLFFANPTTLYVADEGTGDSTDASAHAGLEKWSLIGGAWQLDYTLQSGLIGASYTVSGTNGGVAGTWPTVTTIGLRNLTGEINANSTVTFWATTSTSSASGDNGADPNEIVEITDAIGATSLPGGEMFSVFDPAVYGERYGGVAFSVTGVPEPSTWAMMLIGFAGLGFAGYRRTKTSRVAG